MLENLKYELHQKKLIKEYEIKLQDKTRIEYIKYIGDVEDVLNLMNTKQH
jgi:hypothetical protein